MKYYKILNEEENHNGFQYKDGLNIDSVPFQPKGSCVRGGIYFASKDILAFLDYGSWIREVTIPRDARWVKDPGDGPEKFRADRVILGRRRKITAKVVKELIEEGANIHANRDYAFRYASDNGHTETVKVLLKHGADVHAYDDEALKWASNNGHTETVRLLKEYMKK